MSLEKALQDYYSLRSELDEHCANLYALHAPHLNCREGCDMCCMDFSVFPVEYYAIKEQAGSNLKKGQQPAEGGCPFLINHSCVIYAARPFICRTQGLPLLFMGEEDWELSACELNFTRYDFDDFTQENTFPQDVYNSRLYMINKELISHLPGNPYSPNDLISLSDLFADSR